MSKITRHTDLTQSEGDPTSRADAGLPTEDFQVRVPATRWPAAGSQIKTRATARSPLGNAAAAAVLILAGGLCAVLLHWAGGPWQAQASGLLLPWVICLTLRPTRRNRSRGRGRRRARALPPGQGQGDGGDTARTWRGADRAPPDG